MGRKTIKQVLWLSAALFPVGVWVWFYPNTAFTLGLLALAGRFLVAHYRRERELAEELAAPPATPEELQYRERFERIVEREDWDGHPR